jgi:hypothetical protein
MQILNKIFTVTAITFVSTLVASPSFAGVLCNIGEKRVRQDVIIADAFSEECFASCASKSNQATYNAPPGWAIVRHWTGTRHDRGRTTRNLSFATAQSHFASSSDFSSARSQEASGSAGQYNGGYSAGAKQIESFHNAYQASNTTITLTVTAQGRSPYGGSSKREEALNVEELCIGTIDDYRAAIRDELSLTGSKSNKPPTARCRFGGAISNATNCQLTALPVLQPGVRYWLDTDPRWPGVYYWTDNKGVCAYDGVAAGGGGNHCMIVKYAPDQIRAGVRYWLDTDPRWPGVYYND